MTSALWQHRGMACAAQISPAGIPCGYVGVPEGHPWYRVAYYDIDGVDVHGGLTFSDTQVPGRPNDGLWWVGFDFGHDHDALRLTLALVFIPRAENVTEAELRAEVERLAEQAAQAMAR